MELLVTHRTAGSEAYLLQQDGEETLLYNRPLKQVSKVKVPARFVGRVSWFEFDGDPEPIVEEVRALLEQGAGSG